MEQRHGKEAMRGVGYSGRYFPSGDFGFIAHQRTYRIMAANSMGQSSFICL